MTVKAFHGVSRDTACWGREGLRPSPSCIVSGFTLRDGTVINLCSKTVGRRLRALLPLEPSRDASKKRSSWEKRRKCWTLPERPVSEKSIWCHFFVTLRPNFTTLGLRPGSPENEKARGLALRFQIGQSLFTPDFARRSTLEINAEGSRTAYTCTAGAILAMMSHG
jgi:hypothetical protein